ncbi:MAG TPA: hypothetical protein VJT31_04105, partial [Rugosimonospora sp.]|nr:hypothetical protein [Rugosimonospora sp.]
APRAVPATGAALAPQTGGATAAPAIPVPVPLAGSPHAPARVGPSAVDSPGIPVPVAVARLVEQIDAGQRTGRIRPDVATDLRNTVLSLRHAAAAGQPATVRTLVVALRQKIVSRAQERGQHPGIEPAYAQTMLSTVDLMVRS